MQLAVRITLSPASPEPTYTGGPFASGVAQLDTANPPTADWQADRLVECGTFGERVDVATGGNYGQLLDSEMQISNHDKWFAAFQAAGAVLEGALVEIGEALSSVDMTTRWTGTIADANFQGGNVEIRVESILASRHSMIPARLLTAQEFPGLSSDSEGDAVPILYGDPVAMVPPSIRDTQDLVATFVVSEYPDIEARRSVAPCVSASLSAFKTPWLVRYGDAYDDPWDDYSPYTFADDFGEPCWPGLVFDGEDIFVRVDSGKGAGQTRKIDKYVFSLIAPQQTTITKSWTVEFGVTSPWDTIPDATSVLSFFAVSVAENLMVCDEGVIEKVTYRDPAGDDYVIGSTQGSINDVVTADISGEFLNGENYSAIEYVAPSENFGSPKLTDKVATLTAPHWNTVNTAHVNTLTSLSWYIADSFCRTKMFMTEYPHKALGMDEVKLLFSFSLASRTLADVKLVAIGRKIDGTDEVLADGKTSILNAPNTELNSYSPAIAEGGVYGAFSAYATTLKLPRPLSAYESIRACLIIGATGEYTQLNHTSYGPYTAGSNKIRFSYRSDVASWVVVGTKIRPVDSDNAGYNDERFNIPNYSGSSTLHIGDWRDWRTVTNTTIIFSGGDPVAWEVTLDSAFDVPSGTYSVSVLNNPAPAFFTQNEAESGYAFSVGEVSSDEPFRVDASSGRTYGAHWTTLPSGVTSGDPITLARDAALDMLYRDLGLGADAVDFASFQALPADPIRSALVARVDSAQRMADLCQQFNWAVGHDSDGRETATAWLSRVGSEDYDYSIDTGDVVEETLTGVAVSDITDLINCPNFKYDWTQADGFRKESNVVDVTADPLTLNSGNYLRYLTGFGDFATALDVYESLHASYKISNRKNTGSFELPDVADASGVLWPLVGLDRFNWMGSRKPLLVMTVPDTSAAAFPTVGKRARVRHKRYAPAWVYGTVVQWEHDPMEAETEIVVMVDPGALAEGLLYMDTIDPSGVVPLYTDMADGTTEQYIDQTGA